MWKGPGLQRIKEKVMKVASFVNCGTKHVLLSIYLKFRGWSGGAKVLGNFPVPGRSTYLDSSRVRACCACSRCGGGCLDIFSLVYLSSFLSSSL